MRKIGSNNIWPLLAAAAALAAPPGCETPQPEEPSSFVPGPQEYYNAALGFSLRYPRVLDLKVEDRGVVGEAGISLELQYPGNGYTVFRLATYDTGMRGHIRQYMVVGSERARPVDGETGARFEVEDQSDAGGVVQHIVVERFDRLYVFTGKGETFDEVVDSFRFIDRPRPAGG